MGERTVVYTAAILALLGCGDSSDEPVPVAQACKVNTPVALSITTELPGVIDSKSIRRKATLELNGATLQAEVRGRGNSTWSMPKKPYRFKLSNEASLLGMAPNKDWVLLANYSDKTMLRTTVAWCLGKLTNSASTPEARYVELTVNGEYLGLYQLTWQIEVDSSRVNAAGGFLAEIDAHADGDVVINSRFGSPYVVDEEMAPAAIEAIQKMEAAVSNSTWKELVNEQALSAYYLVSELTKNNDTFWSSTYLYQKPGGKITFGPLWDFDISLGNINYNGNDNPEGWWIRNAGIMAYFFQDTQFNNRVALDWKVLNSRMPEVLTWIDETAKVIDAAQQRNFTRWPILNEYVWPNAVVTGSYSGEVTYLKTWLSTRTTWLDANFKK